MPDRKRSDRGDETMVKGASPQDAGRAPSLNRSVEEAGQAVLAMTRRAADETVGQGRIFLPQAIPEPPRTGIAEVYKYFNQYFQPFVPLNWGFSYVLSPAGSSVVPVK